VEPRVERRLAAILCADVVGYSRLIERDEAGTLRALRSLRREIVDPLLATHGGRVVQVAGDGALVEFGSVVDAVQCAAAVQEAVAAHQAAAPPERRLVLRIGINLGDVVAEGPTSSATASMSRRGWSSCASRGACWSPRPCASMSAIAWASLSRIWDQGH
jgi:class 3 adenylate cyclase